MPVSFQREMFASVWGELKPLGERHSAEVASHGHPLRLNEDMYSRLEAAGALWVFTARLDDGALIGYSAYIVGPSMHYRHVLQATNDSIYVVPEHRASDAGIGLLRYAEAELSEAGVGLLFQTVKAGHDWSAVLQRRGYLLDEIVFCKHLEPAIAAK